MTQAEMFTEEQAASGTPIPANSNPDPDGDRFSWRDEDCVVIQEQPATAVYSNPRGGIVIRQEADGFVNEEDPYVFFATPQAARAVVAAILRELGDAK